MWSIPGKTRTERGIEWAFFVRHHISENDLREDLRLKDGVADLKGVKLAQLERNGAISVQREGNK